MSPINQELESANSTSGACSLQERVRRRALQTQQASAQPDDSGQALRQCLGAADLVFLGIGAIVGAGVFVLTGVAAHDHAG